MFRLHILYALALGFFMAPAAFSQQGACLERTMALTVDRPLDVRSPVLSPTDLRGTYLGKPIQIRSLSFTAIERPIRVLVLIDVSRSMQETGRTEDWNFPLDLASDLIARLPADAEIGAAFFASGLQNIIRPTTDHQMVLDQLDFVRQSHVRIRSDVTDPKLWDALRDGVSLLGPVRFGDVLYVITRGHEQGSTITASEATQLLLGFGVRLFGIVTTTPSRPVVFLGVVEPLETSSQREFLQMVADTGGMQLTIVRPLPLALRLSNSTFPAVVSNTRLGLALKVQYAELLNVYRLTIGLQDPIDKPRKWELQPAKKGNFSLIYPERLFPCF